ncbi:NAC domain-containing protein 17-like [Prosopis cineraria]|uniref:NAC domain-containing protein 17-like n=1 Tax=Prosopis cineraria TaxID=364024 RepID=UPI00240FE542|nr:NAC domain-containing protein 17-like [Prosopis cineraria]
MGLESDSECFSKMMASMPGFRFHPTDEELVMYYLKRKMSGRKLKLDVIRETDVYKWDPEELPAQSGLKTGDRQWFFFSPRDRKYPNAARSSRATRHGYWKATGKDRNVTYTSRTVGVKKTLVFYKGRAPNGERTDWVMHEYTLDEQELQRCQGIKDYFALYKIYKKSGPGPKNGEQYGAPFNEEEWADDDFGDCNITWADFEVPTQQRDGVTSVDTVNVNGPLQPLLDDEIEEIMKKLMDDESLHEQQNVNGRPALPPGVAEETQNGVVDQFYMEVMFPEPLGLFHSSGVQQCGVDPSSDFPQSAISHLQTPEAPKFTSTLNTKGAETGLCEDDFLELDDLIGPEHALLNINKPVENLQFEDGLSELDLYHDAQMFLHDMGPISHPYMNTLDNAIVDQNYELLSNQENANQTGELMMHAQRNILHPAEHVNVSTHLPTSGVLYESARFLTESNGTEESTVGGVAASKLSSSLWNFVESIPSSPASASENALVNRAFERLSSFNKLKIGVKDTNVAAGNDTATLKGGGKKGAIFLFFPVLVALCAFLWVSLGTLRLLGVPSS